MAGKPLSFRGLYEISTHVFEFLNLPLTKSLAFCLTICFYSTCRMIYDLIWLYRISKTLHYYTESQCFMACADRDFTYFSDDTKTKCPAAHEIADERGFCFYPNFV